jgi:hypothetical protein
MSNAGLSAFELAGRHLGAFDTRWEGDHYAFRLPVQNADGRVVEYRLKAHVVGDHASAREAEPRLLPSFCPNRHINSDGTFCMNWQRVDQISITTLDGATRWWETLTQFLRLQYRAARLRSWPDEEQWAHGAAAAHQLNAQESAEILGGRFLCDLRDSRLSVDERHVGTNGAIINVLRDKSRIYAVWRNHDRVVNLRAVCVCDGKPRKVVKACSDHAQAAVTLATSLSEWAREEDAFWASFRGRACCGTLKTCPLA